LEFWPSLYLIAFNPALGELYKKRSVCTKIRLLKIQNRKSFLQTPHPTFFGAFGTSILAPSALELGVPRVMFLGNDPWFDISIDIMFICLLLVYGRNVIRLSTTSLIVALLHDLVLLTDWIIGWFQGKINLLCTKRVAKIPIQLLISVLSSITFILDE